MAETLILAVTSLEPRILALKSGPPALILGNRDTNGRTVPPKPQSTCHSLYHKKLCAEAL